MKMLAASVVTTVIELLLVNGSYAIECPKFPDQAKKDWEVSVTAEVAKIGTLKGAELKTTTRNITKDLFGKLPDAGRLYLEQMMFATYCTALRDDRTITETERSKRLKEYIGEVRKVTRVQNSAKPKGKLAQEKRNKGGSKSPRESATGNNHETTSEVSRTTASVPAQLLALSSRVFRSQPVRQLSETDVRKLVYRYDFYSVGNKASPWQNPDGNDYKHQFVIQHEGQVVVDYATGLVWQRSGSDMCRTYKDAEDYISALNQSKLAGYADWRLPTLEEALSLVKKEPVGILPLHIDSVFDSRIWAMWTSDKLNEGRAWLVLLNTAGCDHYDLSDFMGWARAVR